MCMHAFTKCLEPFCFRSKENVICMNMGKTNLSRTPNKFLVFLFISDLILALYRKLCLIHNCQSCADGKQAEKEQEFKRIEMKGMSLSLRTAKQTDKHHRSSCCENRDIYNKAKQGEYICN